MTTTTASKKFHHLIAAIGLVTILTACGGGSSKPEPDATPDAFTFTAIKDVNAASIHTSNTITVAGINQAADITVTGGGYAINGATVYTTAAGKVENGQTVTLQATAAATPSTAVDVVLTIGGVSATYKVTTLADTVAPTAQILFPPSVSMTEGNSILVRGTASDNFSVKTVSVNGVTATTSDNFKNWQAVVPVATAADTDLVVATEDFTGNKSDSAAKVMIRQANHKSAFPNDDVKIAGVQQLVIDRLDGRNRILLAGSGASTDQIFSVDLKTGERSVFVDNFSTNALALEPTTKRLYAVSLNGKVENMVYFDLADATQHLVGFTADPYFDPDLGSPDTSIAHQIFSLAVDSSGVTPKIVGLGSTNGEVVTNVVSSNTINVLSDGLRGVPNANNLLGQYPSQIAVDNKHNRYLVTAGSSTTGLDKLGVYAVNRSTGERTLLSNNTQGSGELFTGEAADASLSSLGGIAINEATDEAIVSQSSRIDTVVNNVTSYEFIQRVFKVDLTSGNRTVLSGSVKSGVVNGTTNEGVAFVLEGSNSYALMSDSRNRGIVAIDLVTGQRVFFSKSSGGY